MLGPAKSDVESGAGSGGSDAPDVAAARMVGEVSAESVGGTGEIIVGQERVIEELLIAIFAGGHCLMQGVPGLAKTLLVSTLAQTMDLSFQRIQFTPDLMPSDITGTDILQEDPDAAGGDLNFKRGRSLRTCCWRMRSTARRPRRRRRCCRRCRSGRSRSAASTYRSARPFFVLATQNPIEQEGTYPLPEAQLDRFMFMVTVHYPSREEELEVLKRTTGATGPTTQAVPRPGNIPSCRNRAAGAGGGSRV